MGMPKGFKHTEASKEKMSAAQKGKKRSAEIKAKMSAAGIGNKNSLGYKHIEEARTQKLHNKEN